MVQGKKQIIIVLGMHRSGTSAITRGLQVLGANLGNNLMQGVVDNNEKGFWEDNDINKLNEDILKKIGSVWHDTKIIDEAMLLNPSMEPEKNRALKIINQKFKNTSIFAYKDPRTTILLPFWQQIFKSLNLDESYIITLRDPVSVANSLKKRDGIAKEKSFLIWSNYTINAIRYSAGAPRIIVEYDRLLDSPITQLSRISKEIKLADPLKNKDQLNEYINKFLSIDLRHNELDLDALESSTKILKFTKDTYKWLSRIACNEITFKNPSFKKAWLNIETKFYEFSSIYKYVDQINLDNHTAKTERDIAVGERDAAIGEKDAAISKQIATIKENEAFISAMKENIGQLKLLAQELRTEKKYILGSTSWKITYPLRFISQIVRDGLSISRSRITEILRMLFHSLPITEYRKKQLQSWFYTKTPVLFKHTLSYKLWLSSPEIVNHYANVEKNIKQVLTNKFNSSNITDGYNSRYHKKSQRTKHILIVDALTPTPDRDAGSVIAFHFMQILLQLGMHVTFAPDNLQELKKYTADLQKMGVQCLYAPLVTNIFDYIIKEGHQFDVVLLYRVDYANKYIDLVKKYCSKAKVIFHTQDLHYLRMERQAELQQSKSLFIDAEKVKKCELSVMRKADVTIVVSNTEHKILEKYIDSSKILTIPLILEVSGAKAPCNVRNGILYIGGYNHQPNVDAVLYFVKNIWPILKERIPGLIFYIIGNNPPKTIQELQGGGIKVTGYVEKLDKYFNKCRLSVVPLRYGAGIKGKIGTSLSYGLPVVSTPIGIEGMGLQDGKEVLVANDSTDFAKAVELLYTDDVLWQRLSKAGLSFVQQHYSRQAGKKRIKKLLLELKIDLDQKQ